MAIIAPTTTEGLKLVQILAVQEDAEGNLPANPICMEIKAEDFQIKVTQANEEIIYLGTFDAVPDAFGIKTIEGTMNIVQTVENAPFTLSTGLGRRLTHEDTTSDVWTAIQAQAKGDIVNSADGKHTLVCTTAGTTGDAETSFVPNLETNPKDDQNGKIVDGTVVWKAMPKYQTDTFETSEFLPTMTIESTWKTPSGEFYYRRAKNVYSAVLPMAMSGSTISLKQSLAFKGTGFMRSIDDNWDENLLAKTGAKLCKQDDSFYDYESFMLYVDGNSECAESFELSMTRDVKITPLLNHCQRADIGNVKFSGNMNRVFTTQRERDVESHKVFEAKAEFKKPDGTEMVITYPNVQPSNPDPKPVIDTAAYMTNDMKAVQTANTPSIIATVTYPSFVDTTGALQDPLA